MKKLSKLIIFLAAILIVSSLIYLYTMNKNDNNNVSYDEVLVDESENENLNEE